ncbi:hypothetical protein F5144DRAFT_159504 [Chaetomium tenue]|uniref:Uncharacterized protein n=1 Tax=Chaetomium tenue TaxID=1854479 RepID=A0ACB7P9Y0_9PEZI|nr:hypothetical protein F5144DRAFT_159504 [Chaetomium globosum]
MRASIILPQIFLPQNSVKLGRFTTNVEHPHQDYNDPLSTNQPRVLESLRDSYTGEHHVASYSSFASTLTSLVSITFAKRAKAKIRVTTEHVKTYTLDNSERWFEEATRVPATRAWIERRIDKGHDIYMIVGFHTITKAIISQESVDGSSAGGQINVPVSLSLAAAGVVVPLGDTIDPSMAIHQQGLDGTQSQFVAPGEQVCALEYRKLCHSWLSSKHIDKSRLSKVCHWPSMDRARDEEEGEDDIIEVELADVQGLDGDWDREVVDGEVLYMRSFDES